jgi:hypothetical protein
LCSGLLSGPSPEGGSRRGPVPGSGGTPPGTPPGTPRRGGPGGVQFRGPEGPLPGPLGGPDLRTPPREGGYPPKSGGPRTLQKPPPKLEGGYPPYPNFWGDVRRGRNRGGRGFGNRCSCVTKKVTFSLFSRLSRSFVSRATTVQQFCTFGPGPNEISRKVAISANSGALKKCTGFGPRKVVLQSLPKPVISQNLTPGSGPQNGGSRGVGYPKGIIH